jgi:acetoin utilization protein AcuC
MVYDEEFTKYDVPPSYAFSGRRFSDFHEHLVSRMSRDSYEEVAPRRATREDLLTVHTVEYLDYVEEIANEVPGSFVTYLSPDTQVNREMLEANKLLVGAAMVGVELARDRGLPVYTFGGLHHAGPSRGGGFCVLNDVAAAARHGRNQGYERVMVLDTDAHAGDGTMDIFYTDPTVLTISVHHDPSHFYPGRGFVSEIGEGDGKGFCINFYEIFRREVLEPIAREFDPELLIRNGGSDPYVSDIAHLGYTTGLGFSKADLHTLGTWVGDLRDEIGAGYVDIMGSGYDLASIPSCWFALMSGSLHLQHEGEDESLPGTVDSDELVSTARKISDELRGMLSPFWSSLA